MSHEKNGGSREEIARELDHQGDVLQKSILQIRSIIRDASLKISGLGESEKGAEKLHSEIEKTRTFINLLFSFSHATELLSACENPVDFKKLFMLLDIPGEKWRSSGWLEENGFRPLYRAIIGDDRFGSIKAFCEFMGSPREISMDDEDFLDLPNNQQIAACKEPNDFRKLFVLLGIPGEKWRSSGWLEENGFRPLYRAIKGDDRFGSIKAFYDFMDNNSANEQIKIIGAIKLEELFSIFADRPGQIKLYLEANHPHMTEKEIDTLILQGFKSFFGGHNGRDAEYLTYDESLASIELDENPPATTDEKTLLLCGTANGAQYVHVSGTGNRRCKVTENGRFEIVLPLRIGKENEIRLTAVHTVEKVRSSLTSFIIEQEGEVDDVEELIHRLSAMGKAAVASIRENPGKYEHIKSRLKHVLIRKFSKNFDEGERYVRSMIDGNHSTVIKKMLSEILKEFKKIDRTEFPNMRPEEPMYLFQKYCAHLIQERIKQGRRGVILANDPGLGKTRTALAAINGDDAVIVAPNSVVSAWSEEAAHCLKNPDLLVMQDMNHTKRKELLKKTTAKHRITNIQFVQKHLDDERFSLLANENTVVVQDEAHSRANLESDQTKGMRKLSEIGKFQLLLSATPFKNSKSVRRVLHTLHPERLEFGSESAFEKAFPSNDPKALQTIRLLLEEDMIRFTKRDALEEMDPKIPIKKQIHKLPRKEFIPPAKTGEFTISDAQAHVLYEMFLNWDTWSKKYGKYIPKDKVTRMDGVRKGDALSKRHAYRQVVNNPEFVNLCGVSNAKARMVQRIVEESIREGRKVEIFCQYNSQAQLYAEMLKVHRPSLYTGITSEEGVKRGSDGKPILFHKDEHGRWTFDKHGYPIPDPEGEPMLALDYERLTFQNAPDRKIVIATYAAGAVGTTFTAAKTVIKDDLPRDCIEDEQSDDRTHRIDHEHQTHHTVKHYNLISTYSKKFLNDMKKRWVEKMNDGTYKEIRNEKIAKEKGLKSAYQQFFEQRTLDEVHFGNLQVQKSMMHLILDGIADESILNEDQRKFMGIEE